MDTNIQVGIRVRPIIERERQAGLKAIWRTDQNEIHDQKTTYCFDRVFDQNADTLTVYNDLSKPIVTNAMEGFNGTIFAYGQTASGKTHTIMGDKKELGILPLAIRDVFNYTYQQPDREFLLTVSYIEIYNEEMTDLLADNKKGPIKIRNNSDNEVFIDNLTEPKIISYEDALSLIQKGMRNRRIGTTNMNERSSRSHVIFRLVIESRQIPADSNLDFDGAVSVSQLNLVDLAGSERVAQTGAQGIRLKESAFINQSLLTLGLVIRKLSDNDGHIPYRDSKLTRILQNSLGGNARTSIICAVSPVVQDETDQTLKFACRAKEVTNKPIKNEIVDGDTMMRRQMKEISDLRKKLQEFESGTIHNDLIMEKDKMQQTYQHTIEEQKTKIERLKEQMLCSGRTRTRVERPDMIKKSDRRLTWCPGSLHSYQPQPILTQDLSASISSITTRRSAKKSQDRMAAVKRELAAEIPEEVSENTSIGPGSDMSFEKWEYTIHKEEIEDLKKQIEDLKAAKPNSSSVDNTINNNELLDTIENLTNERNKFQQENEAYLETNNKLKSDIDELNIAIISFEEKYSKAKEEQSTMISAEYLEELKSEVLKKSQELTEASEVTKDENVLLKEELDAQTSRFHRQIQHLEEEKEEMQKLLRELKNEDGERVSKSEFVNLQTELSFCKETLAVKEDHINELQNEVATSKEDQLKIQEELTNAMQKCVSYSEQLKSSENEIKAKQSNIVNNEEKISFLVSELEESRTLLNMEKSAGVSYQQLIETMKEEFVNVKNENLNFQSKLENVEHGNEAVDEQLHKQIKDFETQIESMLCERNSDKEKQDYLITEIHNLKEEAVSEKEQSNEMLKQIEEDNSKILHLEQQIQQISADKNNLLLKLTSTEENFEMFKKEAEFSIPKETEAQTNDSLEFKEKVVVLENEIIAITKQLSEKNTSYQELHEDKEKINESLTNLKSDYEYQKNELHKYEDVLKTTNINVTETLEYQNLQRELELIKATNIDIKDTTEYKRLQKEFEVLETSNSKTLAEYQSLNNELELMKTSKSNLTDNTENENLQRELEILKTSSTNPTDTLEYKNLQRELELLKAANINVVETIEYQNLQRQLELLKGATSSQDDTAQQLNKIEDELSAKTQECILLQEKLNEIERVELHVLNSSNVRENEDQVNSETSEIIEEKHLLENELIQKKEYIAQLESQFESLKQQLESLSEENNSLKVKLTKVENKENGGDEELQKLLEETKHELASSLTSKDQSDELIKSLQNEIQSKYVQIKEFQTKLMELNYEEKDSSSAEMEELNSLKKENENLLITNNQKHEQWIVSEKTVSELQEKLINSQLITDGMTNEKSAIEEELINLKSLLEEMTNEKSITEEELSNLKTLMENVTKEKSTVEEELSNLKTLMENVTTEKSTVEEELSNLKTLMEEVIVEKCTLEEHIESLSEERLQLHEQLKMVESLDVMDGQSKMVEDLDVNKAMEEEEQHADVEVKEQPDLSSSTNELQSEIQSLKVSHTKLEEHITHLNEQLVEFESLKELNNELNGKLEETNELKAQNLILQKDSQEQQMTLEEMKQQKNEMREELEIQKQTKLNLQSDIETFKDCMESQQSENETLQAAFDNQTVKINDLTNQNSQLEVLSNEKEQLQLAFDELSYEKQSLVETNESLEQQINDLNENISSLRAEYDNKLNQGKIIIEELSAAHDKIMLLESLQDVKQHKDEELKLLQDQLLEKDELITNSQHQKVTLEEEISLVKSDLTEKENIISDLREEVHGFQSVYDTERIKFKDLQKASLEIEYERDELNGMIGSLREQIIGLEETIATLSTKEEQKEVENDVLLESAKKELQEQLELSHDFKEQIATLKSCLSDQEESYNLLKHTKEETNLKVEDLVEQLKAKAIEIEEIKEKVENEAKIISSLEDEKQYFEASLKQNKIEAETKSEELIRCLRNLQKENISITDEKDNLAKEQHSYALRISSMEEDIKLKESEIFKLNGNITELNTHIVSNTEHLNEIESLKEGFKTLMETNETISEEKQNLEQQIHNLESLMKEKVTHVEQLQKTIEELKIEATKVAQVKQNENNENELFNRYMKLKAEMDLMKNKERKALEPITEENKENSEENITQLKEKLRRVEYSLSLTKEDVRIYYDRVREQDSEIKKMKDEKERYKVKINKFAEEALKVRRPSGNASLKEWEELVTKLEKESISMNRKMERSNEKIEKLNKRLVNQTTDLNNAMIHIDQKQKEILRLSSLIENNDDIACQEQIIKLKSQIKIITEERNKFEAGLEKAFTRMKSAETKYTNDHTNYTNAIKDKDAEFVKINEALTIAFNRYKHYKNLFTLKEEEYNSLKKKNDESLKKQEILTRKLLDKDEGKSVRHSWNTSKDQFNTQTATSATLQRSRQLEQPVESRSLQNNQVEPRSLQNNQVEPRSLQINQVEPRSLQNNNVRPRSPQDKELEAQSLQTKQSESRLLRDSQSADRSIHTDQSGTDQLTDTREKDPSFQIHQQQRQQLSKSLHVASAYTQPNANINKTMSNITRNVPSTSSISSTRPNIEPAVVTKTSSSRTADIETFDSASKKRKSEEELKGSTSQKMRLQKPESDENECKQQ